MKKTDDVSEIETMETELTAVQSAEISATETETKTKKNTFKTLDCKVLKYHPKTNALDIDFQGYGLRINGVTEKPGDTVAIKYKGKIGQSNFQYKLG